jgi:Zinc carboxypeptidase
MKLAGGLERLTAIAALPLLAGACQYMPSLPSMGFSSNAICSAAGLRVDIDFTESGRHDCIVGPDGSIVVSVDHEPAFVEGINPSPWFAFRITTEAPRATTVTLDYTDYNHRYAPYVSTDGRSWQKLADSQVTLNEKKTRATLKLDLVAGATWIAGQPLSPSNDNVDWTRNALSGHGFTETRYGDSLEGKPLVGFVGGGGLDAIVVLTRQHPPETTGQDAYRGFVDRLLNRDDAKATAFRGRYRILLAPMPNPDGVDAGNWRLNAGGIDLNRDWGAFTQPETKALSQWIITASNGRRVVSMMDFHSTDKTVIYAPPLEAASPTIGILTYLKQAFDTTLSAPPEWSYNHNPDGGTSKGWALDTLKAPGITVELWDQIPTADARKLGATAADALIDYFAK